ncbi:hypothetical protein DFQ28_003382 [Apophysomyces sp. BC1034]|nr:hypothetical protein DFQ30_006354 [Apophysomyces sp. BC1015]KAG0180700.1 hypothetical protein DFQ29_000157 [Apophysomyces sp. BC1021]KAG0189454.1 hypothetical protein DFQ28_003382 [Apophysomyces sp. BC1034]
MAAQILGNGIYPSPSPPPLDHTDTFISAVDRNWMKASSSASSSSSTLTTPISTIDSPAYGMLEDQALTIGHSPMHWMNNHARYDALSLSEASSIGMRTPDLNQYPLTDASPQLVDAIYAEPNHWMLPSTTPVYSSLAIPTTLSDDPKWATDGPTSGENQMTWWPHQDEEEDDDCLVANSSPFALTSASIPLSQMSRAQLIERVLELEKERATRMMKSGKRFGTDDEEEVETYPCRWVGCHFQAPTLDQLTTHLRDAHIGSGKPAYYCDWLGCPRNKKPFMKRHKMHNHMRTHTGERPFACTVQGCNKRFSRPDSLSTHIKTHSNVRPYICPAPGCGKAYFHSRSLRKHTKSSHSKPRLENEDEDEEGDSSDISKHPVHHLHNRKKRYHPYERKEDDISQSSLLMATADMTVPIYSKVTYVPMKQDNLFPIC